MERNILPMGKENEAHIWSRPASSTRSAPLALCSRPSLTIPVARLTPAPGQSLQLQTPDGLLQTHPPKLPSTSTVSAAPGSPQCQTNPLSVRLQRTPIHLNTIQPPQTHASGLPWKTQASGTIVPSQHQASPHIQAQNPPITMSVPINSGTGPLTC